MYKFLFTIVLCFSFAKITVAQENNNLYDAQKKAVIDAVTYSDNNILIEPTKPRIWLERAIAYLDLASFPDTTIALRDLEAPFKALNFISEVLKLDTKNGIKGAWAKEAEYLLSGNIQSKAYSAFMNLAVITYDNKDYLKSYKFIKKAYEIAPNDTTTAYWKGAISTWCNEYAEAKEAFESYLKFGGLDIKVMYSLWKLYLLDENEFESYKIKSKAIAIYGLANWNKQENNSTSESDNVETAIIQKENASEFEIKKEDATAVNYEEDSPTNEKSNVTLDVKIEIISNKSLELNNFKNSKSKSLIPFKLKNGFYNILNSNNSKIDIANYDEIIPSHFNYLKVRKEELWGLVNTDGETIVPVKYELILDENINYILATNFDRRYGFVSTDVYNRVGVNIVSKGFKDDFGYDFKEISSNDLSNSNLKIKTNILLNTFEWSNHRSGFTIFDQDKLINKTIKPDNDFLTAFNEFNNAIIYSYEEKNIKVIDSNNNVLFKTKYHNDYDLDILEYLGENLYSLRDQNGLLALINISGKRLTPFKFKTIRKFKNNRALVQLDNSYFEFIDKNGRSIISLGNDFRQDDIQDFENYLSVNSKNVIDTLGNEIYKLNSGNDKIILIKTFFSNHFNFMNQNYKYGIISTNGKVIVPPKYDYITKFKFGYALVKQNDKMGIINDSGEEILKVKYDKIYCLEKNELGDLKYNDGDSIRINVGGDDIRDFVFIVFNGLIKVESNGQEFFVDISGNEFREK
jgi:hypothetical protein